MNPSDFIADYLYAVAHQHELIDEVAISQEKDYHEVYHEWFVSGHSGNDVGIDQQEYNTVTELYEALVELDRKKKLHEINVNLYYTKTRQSEYLDLDWWICVPVYKNKQACTLVLDFYEDGLYNYHEVQIDEETANRLEDIASPIYYIGVKEIEELLTPIIRKEIIKNYFYDV